jgi:hypothetical protein
MSEDQRLERIEKKLDEMSEAIVALARMEERMVTLFNRMDRYDEDQKDIGKRLREVEERQGLSGHTLRFMERIFWIGATAALTIWIRGQLG